MKVCVVGLGYIGLPTALSMAAGGIEVIGVDLNEKLVATLKKGTLTFEEKGLPELFERAVQGGVTFTGRHVPADVYIVAVPTPYDEHNKKIDVRYIENAVADICGVCPKGAIIAVESTISPGTMDGAVRPIIEKAGFVPGRDVHIAHVPERIIPGNMLYELEHNSRTIGVESAEAGEILKKVYSSFCKAEMVVTNMKVAEMTKVVENTFRDVNIAFANEISRICHDEGIDVYEVLKIANMHPRVQILKPGPGVGGHCISVDPWFLVGGYPDIVNVISAARHVNDSQPSYILKRVSRIMEDHSIKNLSEVGFYGLTYKQNVDDTRESPTLQIIERMRENLASGARFFDPFIKEKIVDDQYMDFESFLDGIKLVVVMVSHDHIKERESMLKGKVVFDTQNCLNKHRTVKL